LAKAVRRAKQWRRGRSGAGNEGADDLAQEIEKKTSLADMSLDQLAAERARLPETSEEARMYHDEIVRRHSQTTLDTTTVQLISERRRYSTWTVVILALAIFAMVAGIMLQK
jgi:hypothetical protein